MTHSCISYTPHEQYIFGYVGQGLMQITDEIEAGVPRPILLNKRKKETENKTKNKFWLTLLFIC